VSQRTQGQHQHELIEEESAVDQLLEIHARLDNSEGKSRQESQIEKLSTSTKEKRGDANGNCKRCTRTRSERAPFDERVKPCQFCRNTPKSHFYPFI
jgi:hypothetical protein